MHNDDDVEEICTSNFVGVMIIMKEFDLLLIFFLSRVQIANKLFISSLELRMDVDTFGNWPCFRIILISLNLQLLNL